MTANDPRPADLRQPVQPATAPADPASAWATTDPAYGAATSPVQPAVVRGRRGSGGLINLVLGAAVVVAIGGVAFGVGRATAPAAAAGAGRAGFGAAGGGPTASGAPGGFGGAGGGAASIQGTVTAVAADSITLQLPSGQSITIPTTASTTYHERTAATAADVTSGATVIVQVEGGRGGFGPGGQGGQGGGPASSGAPAPSGGPARGFGNATAVTVVPAGS
ncbi:MAG: hypothetical protein QOF49_1691 [Chloroflexota bacterium]|jgi:hypothetical protein|nr:hypothetical protein [Chloroflexota bacterium]